VKIAFDFSADAKPVLHDAYVRVKSGHPVSTEVLGRISPIRVTKRGTSIWANWRQMARERAPRCAIVLVQRTIAPFCVAVDSSTRLCGGFWTPCAGLWKPMSLAPYSPQGVQTFAGTTLMTAALHWFLGTKRG